MNNNITNESINSCVLSDFIKQTIECNRTVAIFLSTGVKLQGQIISYDNHTIKVLCTRDKTNIIIFIKHITTISDKENSENTDRGVFG